MSPKEIYCSKRSGAKAAANETPIDSNQEYVARAQERLAKKRAGKDVQ